MVLKDQLGNEVTINEPFQRIISLVPSQTELLIDLIGTERLAGRTKFCIHPGDRVGQVPVVGGTKQFNFEKIAEIQPDLIIGNKEENYKEGIERLQEDYPVWVSDISTIEDNFDMVKSLGQLVNATEKANQLIVDTREALTAVCGSMEGRVLYFIWQNPFLVAGRNTFIDHLITYLGFENVCIQMRYPEMDRFILEKLKPEYVFLSSEPFPFKKKHINSFRELFPSAEIRLVDGEMFSWYGSRLKQAGSYFLKELLACAKR